MLERRVALGRLDIQSCHAQERGGFCLSIPEFPYIGYTCSKSRCLALGALSGIDGAFLRGVRVPNHYRLVRPFRQSLLVVCGCLGA